MSDPEYVLKHEFTLKTGSVLGSGKLYSTSQCWHVFTHAGREIICGMNQDHEWHYDDHCTKCDNTGIIWTAQAVRLRPGYPNSPVTKSKINPVHCDCEEGQLMSEFL